MRRAMRRVGVLCRENSAASVIGLLVENFLGIRRLRTMRIHGQTVAVRTCSPDVPVALSCLGPEYRTLRHALTRDDEGLIIDAGGNIGAAALALAALCPRATVVSIEPCPENFAILKRNIARHPNIHAEHAALVTDDGCSEVKLRDRGSSVGFTVVERSGQDELPVARTVPAISLRAIMEKYGHSKVLLLKMDIEGGELGLLERPDWLDSVGILMIELHDKIVPGCASAFFRASARRYVYRADGEKFISVGRSFLDRTNQAGSAVPPHRGPVGPHASADTPKSADQASSRR